MSCHYLTLWILLLCGTSLVAQEVQGLPLIRNYSPTEYGGHRENVGILQTKDRIMYFANAKGVLQYDGQTWQLVELPNKGGVASFSITDDETLYVGATNDLGVLKTDEKGELYFESWLDKLPEEYRNFGHLFSTVSTSDATFWQANDYFFRWKNGELKAWKPSERIRRFYIYKDVVYMQNPKKGLCFIKENGQAELTPNGAFLEKAIVDFIVPYKDKVLIGADPHGLVIYDGQTFEPFEVDIDVSDKNVWFETGVYLYDDLFALTLNVEDGLYIINRAGKVLDHIYAGRGLEGNNVKSLFFDQEKGLWIALESGLARIDMIRPFSVFDERNGLKGAVKSIYNYQNELHIATSEGLFSAKNNNTDFEAIPELTQNVRSIIPWTDKLLLGTDNAGYTYDGEKIELIGRHSPTATILPSRYEANTVFIINGTGMVVYKYENNQWGKIGEVDEMTGSVRGIIEIEKGKYWLKTISNGMFYVSTPIKNDRTPDYDSAQVKHYAIDKGVPLGNNILFWIDEMILLRSEEDALYRYDQDKDRFLLYTDFATHFGLSEGLVLPKINKTTKPILWLDYFKDKEQYLLKAEKLVNGKYNTILYPFNENLASFNDIFTTEKFHGDGNTIWLGGINGVIQYQLDKAPDQVAEFPVYINAIFSKDSLLKKHYIDSTFQLNIPYQQNDLTFTYTAPLYQEEPFREYQYQLQGFDADWSAWTAESKKGYTNLREGNYQFRVRAKDSYGTIQEAEAVLITITPPWYRSIVAYCSYVLLLAGLIYALLQFRSKRLQEQNVRLEAVVKERTKTIQQQADELEELNRLKSRFFANISHELRTPLTLILGPVEDLLKSNKKPGERGTLNLVRNNAARLLKLINQLLDLSKLDANKLELHAYSADLIDFCKQLTFYFQSMADQRGLQLHFEAAEPKLLLYYDTEKMEQILLNLLSNALKFTKTGGEIKVQIQKTETSAQLIVKDSGIGMSPEQLPHVFDRFYQVDSEDTRLFEGTGIGLSLTKELVELHSGTIEVESEKGVGTQFLLTFPLGKAHLTEEQLLNTPALKPAFSFVPEEPVTPVLPQTGLDTTEKPLLLIADDHAELRQYIRSHFQEHYHTLEANDGLEAWNLALEQTPDLIISDVMMPNMSGYELCEKIKGDMRTNHIPLILLTAKSGVDEKIKGLGFQADDYLTKPFNSQELQLKVNNLILLRNRLQKRFEGQTLFETKEIEVSSQEEIFLNNLAEAVEGHIADTGFGVEQLSSTMGMSRSQLNRKMRALLNKTPNQYIRSYRLARARQLIEKNAATIAEISYDTGFSSPAYFSKCFLDEYGYSPTEVKVK